MWLTDLKFKICAEVVVHRTFAVFLNSLNGKNSSSIVRDIFCSRFQDNTTSNFYIVISGIRIVSYTRDQHLLFVYDRAPASKSCAFCIGIKFFFSPFDRFLVPSCCKDYFLEKVSCMQHFMRFRRRVSSQIQLGDFTNLLCKSVKCLERIKSALQRKRSAILLSPATNLYCRFDFTSAQFNNLNLLSNFPRLFVTRLKLRMICWAIWNVS